jgi:hypothetical protein
MKIKKTVDKVNPWHFVQQQANDNLSIFAIRVAIVLWSIVMIFLALTVTNKWVLSGMLGYELLP